jgi:hypothetical protein
MAYVSQEFKAKVAPVVQAICKKYGVKGSLSVRHHSTLVLTLRQGKLDLIGNYNRVCSSKPRPAHSPFVPATKSIDVNTYWYQDHFDDAALAFLTEIVAAMKGPGFFDHTDIQTDYFHCSHYIDINIGRWDRPYAVSA